MDDPERQNSPQSCPGQEPQRLMQSLPHRQGVMGTAHPPWLSLLTNISHMPPGIKGDTFV